MKVTKAKVVTREDKIEKAKKTLKEVSTTTRVKAWTFQIEKTFYVIVSYFAPKIGPQMAVFVSNRKGIRLNNEEIAVTRGKEDVDKIFDMAITKLIPEESATELDAVA
jgi:tryptophan synthase beta subunit